MNYISLFKPFIISLILGALLGLERAFATRGGEYDANTLGGVRTFSLLSLLGCLASFIDNKYQPGILIISFIGILILTGISYYVSYTKDNERGITTEISLLLCFTIGVVTSSMPRAKLCLSRIHLLRRMDHTSSRCQLSPISKVHRLSFAGSEGCCPSPFRGSGRFNGGCPGRDAGLLPRRI